MQSLTPNGGNGYTASQVLDVLKGRTGSRQMTFRYDLLDDTDTYVADLTDSVLSCSISLNNLADIKRTAKFTVEDVGLVNFLSDRIKPYARLAMPSSSDTYTSTLGASLIRWAMDDTSGTSVPDSSGNGHNGTIAGTGITKNKPGLLDTGSSYNFSAAGTASVASLAGATFLNGLEEMSIVAWVRPSSVGVSSNIVQAGSGSSSNLAYAATGTPGSALSVIQATVVTDHGNIVAVTQAGTQSLQTQCIVMTWRAGGQLSIYVNGALATLSSSSGQGTVGVTTGADTFAVGRSWVGDIDDVSVLPRVLTADEVLALYQSGAQVGPFGSSNYVEWPLGVFLLSSPSRSIDEGNTITRDIDAYDKLLIFSDDLVTDRYSLAAGTVVTDQVRTILTGSTTASVVNSAATLPTAREWEPGTSKLAIINDLLSSINYRSLSFDESGKAIVQPYQTPAVRASEFEYADDDESVSLPQIDQTLDLFAVPNRWVLVVSDPDRSSLSSTYTNDDPTSLTSTVSRGRVIVDFRTEQSAVDQTSLDGLAQRLAFEASQIFEEIAFETALMPMHSFDDVYTLTFNRLAIGDKYSGHTWDLPLVAGQTMKHTARRVVQV
jgi:hypothetical protein